MTLPLVSIGIPAYNRPEKLKSTLKCIKDQTYSNIEIIVSDDCSPNKEVQKVVDTAIESGQKIQFFRQATNIGATKNFEFVLSKSSGKYFCWVEDEDACEPSFIQTLAEFLEGNLDIVSCACDVKSVDNDNLEVRINCLDTIRPSQDWTSARKLFFQYPTTNIFFSILGMFRAEYLKKSNINYLAGWKGYETNGEVPFLAQIASYGRMVALPVVLKSYRLNPESIYHSEVKSMSYFNMIMLRLVVRWRLASIALLSQLPLLVRISLLGEIVFSWAESVKISCFGVVGARYQRIRLILNKLREIK